MASSGLLKSAMRSTRTLRVISASLLWAASAGADLSVIALESAAIAGNPQGNSSSRNVSVYVPPSYDDADRPYPVLYLLHGSTGTNRLWTGSGYLAGYNIEPILDELISNGQIQPLIVVMPDCDTSADGSWYTNSPLTGNWEEFLVLELVSHMDANYRTLPDRRSRAIAGHSMGGYGAMYLALKHPEKYSVVYSTSGILALEEAFLGQAQRNRFLAASAAAWSPDLETNRGVIPWEVVDGKRQPIPELWTRWLAHDPVSLIPSYLSKVTDRQSIAFDCGLSDELVHANRAFSEALAAAGVEHSYEEFSGGHLDRTTAIVREKILPYVSDRLADAPAMTLVEPRTWAGVKKR